MPGTRDPRGRKRRHPDRRAGTAIEHPGRSDRTDPARFAPPAKSWRPSYSRALLRKSYRAVPLGAPQGIRVVAADIWSDDIPGCETTEQRLRRDLAIDFR